MSSALVSFFSYLWENILHYLWLRVELLIGYLHSKFYDRPRYEPLRQSDEPTIDDIGEWPRRLLYVPSMTSYEWQTGNRYGRYSNPRYNAISYTWGRFALDAEEQPAVRGLKINGITWKLPRINPETHFTVEEFERVIRAAVKHHMTHGRWAARHRDLKFIWLDIACIDQTFPRWATLEIGRQAAIFGRANRVHVWLSHQKEENLQVYLGDIVRAGKEAYATMDDLYRLSKPDVRDFEGDWVHKTTSSLQSLLMDPYFSSLWTLQEGYLSPAAIIISQTAVPVVNLEQHNMPITLYDLAHALRRIHSKCVILFDIQSSKQDAFWQLTELIVRSGIGLYIIAQPMVLYGISRYRLTTYPEDRIYGVQQVFQFQLGKSNPRADPNRHFSLEELEDELGIELLKTWPSLSQLFVHTVTPALGRGWHMTDESVVPSFGHSGRQSPSGFARACKLSTVEHGNITWGTIKGLSCTFRDMRHAWKELYGYKDNYQTSAVTFCHRIALDAELRKQLDGVPMACPPAGKIQHDIAEAIAVLKDGSALRVLLLDAIEPSPNWANYYGIIVRHQQDDSTEYWHRLGVCQWVTLQEYDDHEVVPFLRGLGPKWAEIEGLYA
ncbi:hypothetical protein BDV96DRAFT_639303 [Lophiotrema nucula]|uniref:Heterokaryon incompatibility domain-containing protein n=1 Tax=Lophiotrema nucula TaxID=690887 RepID=A0A6A5ZUT7_9PLEO|nr:hypothetical protein BDV96DRAFT_639303 [Lophiotrema nucula]